MLATRERDRVELVEEENARREPPRLHERVVEVALADAVVRIEDVLDAHVRERQPALTCGRARKQRLAAAGRSEQQHAAAGAAPVLLVQVLPLERKDDRAV